MKFLKVIFFLCSFQQAQAYELPKMVNLKKTVTFKEFTYVAHVYDSEALGSIVYYPIDPENGRLGIPSTYDWIQKHFANKKNSSCALEIEYSAYAGGNLTQTDLRTGDKTWNYPRLTLTAGNLPMQFTDIQTFKSTNGKPSRVILSFSLKNVQLKTASSLLHARLVQIICSGPYPTNEDYEPIVHNGLRAFSASIAQTSENEDHNMEKNENSAN